MAIRHILATLDPAVPETEVRMRAVKIAKINKIIHNITARPCRPAIQPPNLRKNRPKHNLSNDPRVREAKIENISVLRFIEVQP